MKKILYIEDNEMNRDMLGRRLTRREFEVIFAFDGQEGLEKMKSRELEHEVLRLVYKNNDVVFINVNSLHKIAKYSGSGEAPVLNSLNNQDWVKKKKKIKTKIVDMANDLIKLYLKRIAYFFRLLVRT